MPSGEGLAASLAARRVQAGALQLRVQHTSGGVSSTSLGSKHAYITAVITRANVESWPPLLETPSESSSTSCVKPKVPPLVLHSRGDAGSMCG